MFCFFFFFFCSSNVLLYNTQELSSFDIFFHISILPSLPFSLLRTMTSVLTLTSFFHPLLCYREPALKFPRCGERRPGGQSAHFSATPADKSGGWLVEAVQARISETEPKGTGDNSFQQAWKSQIFYLEALGSSLRLTTMALKKVGSRDLRQELHCLRHLRLIPHKGVDCNAFEVLYTTSHKRKHFIHQSFVRNKHMRLG
uniref:Putative secreted protein n=1 Tax=Rhipicephalus microplus TaxID=6941 RepID=A0A6M2D980_RHIMP